MLLHGHSVDETILLDEKSRVPLLRLNLSLGVVALVCYSFADEATLILAMARRRASSCLLYSALSIVNSLSLS